MKTRLKSMLSLAMAVLLLLGNVPVPARATVQIISNPTGGAFALKEQATAVAAPTEQVTVRFLDYQGDALLTDTVKVGESYPADKWPTPTRDGYLFIGWRDGSEIITTLSDLQADVSLTAQYVQLFTVTFENWDGTVLKTVEGVRAGTDLVCANLNGEKPSREGFAFARWEPEEIPSISQDQTVTATFRQLTQYVVVINYIYKSKKQAADPYVAVVSEGFPLEGAVVSPPIMGYTPDQASVSVSQAVTHDYYLDVTYQPNESTRYQLIHKQQTLAGGYETVETEQRSGETGSMTTVAAGDENAYEGFTLHTNLSTCNDEIAADGSTTVELLYDRDIHFVMFDTADGTYLEPRVGLYGAGVSAPANPTRSGYAFAGWDKPIPTAIGSKDVTVTALWTPKSVTYTAVIWRENADNANYSYTATVDKLTGLAGSVVNTFNPALITDGEKSYFTYNRCDPVTLRGDGASVLNVYCTRNVYKASFRLKRNDTYLLYGNGVQVNHTGNADNVDYWFEAKYNATITEKWPASVGPDRENFYGWLPTSGGSVYTSKRITFTSDLLSRTYTASYGEDCRDTIIYMLETPDGTGAAYTHTDGVTRRFAPEATLGQVVYSNGGTWGRKELSGFAGLATETDITEGNTRNPKARTVTLYYARNKKSLTFSNVGVLTVLDPVYFGASIAGCQRTPQRPADVPADYVFTGWYTDQMCYPQSLFVWAGATMPANGLLLHAGWQKPVYAVTFGLNYPGGGTYAANQTEKGSPTSAVGTPTRDGYRFDYWYYADETGAEKLFTFSMPITHAYAVLAHWTASNVGYTVRYTGNSGSVMDAQGRPLADKAGEDSVGALVTATAPAAYDSQGKPLFPDTVSSSLTLAANADHNVITFTYSRADAVYYLVRYVDAAGAELAPAVGPTATNEAIVTVNYQNIAGYSPLLYQQTRILAAETSTGSISQNVITFVYTPNPKGTYTVRYSLQNILDNGYTQDEAAALTVTDQPLGSTARATILPYSGFTFVPGISVATGVVYASKNNPLVLRLYYNRNTVAYTASYLDRGTDPAQRLTADTVASARYGRQVSLLAKDILGYTLNQAQSPSPATLTLAADPAANHVDFYYDLRTDIAVTVRFVDANGDNIATSHVFTGQNDRSVLLGATYAYSLAESEKVILFNGETYRHRADEATTASCKVSALGNELLFHYVPDTYAVAYHANGGEGAPADPATYRAGAAVTLAEGAPTYGENRFEGWCLSEAVLGHVYDTPAALAGVTLAGETIAMPAAPITLYAVWSHLTATLHYACDTPFAGTLPADSEAPLSTPVTVADGSALSRAGYAFAGWKLKNENAQLADPAYGPGTAHPTLALTANATLYATWQAVSYPIAYQNNLPAAAQARWSNPNTQAAYTVESGDLSLAAPSCTGYAFAGWFTDIACQTSATVPAQTAGSTGARTYFAKFTVASLAGLRAEGVQTMYNAAPHGVTLVDANSQLMPGDSVVYSTPNAYTDVTGGAVPVTVTVYRDGEAVWSGAATVTVSPRPLALSMEKIDTMYDGLPHSFSVTVPQGANGTATAADAFAIYSSLTFTMGGAAVANTFTDATVQTSVTVSASHPNYTVTPATSTVTIKPREVIITADSLTGVVYDGLAHAVTTWTVAPPTDQTGLMQDDSVGTVTMIDSARTNVGTSAPTPSQATLSTGKAVNYQFVYHGGVLEIVPSNALTLTLSAGAGNYRFDGLAHGFTVDTAGVPVTLAYRLGASGDWKPLGAAETLPAYTQAGKYPLSVRASNPNYANQPTDTQTLTIAKRPVTLRAESKRFAYTGQTFTMDAWRVDGPTADAGLVGTDAITGVAFENNTRSALGSNAVAIAPAAWSPNANPDNYEVTPVAGEIAVTQNTGALGIATADLPVSYDGKPHRLTYTVTAPENTPYTVSYRLGTDDWEPLAADALLPTVTDAGAYPFTLRVQSPNYQNDGTASATLTIARRPLTLTAGTDLTHEYDGKPVSVTYTDVEPNGTTGLLPGDKITAALTGSPQTEAGDYAVTFDAARTVIKTGKNDVTANYEITYVPGRIRILKAPSAAADTQAKYPYDATAHAYRLPVLTDTDERTLTDVSVAYSTVLLAPEAEGWLNAPLPTETDVPDAPGEPYRIYVRLTHPNYATQTVTATLTVTPAPVTLTAERNDHFPYTLLADGAAKVWSIHTAHWQVEGLAQDTLYADDTLAYTLADATQSQVDEGHAVTFATYAIANPAHAKNYAVTAVDGFIRVVQGTAKATLTAEGFSQVYDAQAHALPAPTVTVADENGDPLERSADYTFTYRVTKDGKSTDTAALPTFTEAGEYTVRISAESALHAEPKRVTMAVTISPRPLTLTSGTLVHAYDAQPHTVAILAQATGYAPGAGHAAATATLALLSDQQSTATLAGVYPVRIDPQSVTVLAGDAEVTANYTVSTVAGSLTITPVTVAAAQLALADVANVYDGLSHALSIPVTLSVGGVALDLTDATRFTLAYQSLDLLNPGLPAAGATQNPSYTDVSAHTVTVTVTDTTGSLAFEPASATVTVTPRSITVTAASGEFPYTGAPHTVTGYTVETAVPGGTTGLVGGDRLAVTLAGATRTAAGTNPVTWHTPVMLSGSLANYTLIAAQGTLSVTPAASLALSVTPQGGVFDGQPHGFAFTTDETDASVLTLAYSTDSGATWTPFATATQLPTYTDAGDYPLLVRAQSPNFAQSTQTPAFLRITPRPVTVTPVDATVLYDGTPQQLSRYTVEQADTDGTTPPAAARGLLGGDQVTVTLRNARHTDAGEYAVDAENAQPVGGTRLANYAFDYGRGTLTIRKRDGLSISLTADSAPYDSQTHGFAVDVRALGESQLHYSTDGGLQWTPFATADDLPTLVTVGDMPLTVRLTNANYSNPTATATATLRLTPAALTLRVQSKQAVFDSQPHSLTLTAEGLAGDDALGAYTLNPASGTAAGVYTVLPVAGDTLVTHPLRSGNQLSNYALTVVAGTLTLVDFTLAGYAAPYDGGAHGVTVTLPAAFADAYAIAYTANGVTSATPPLYTDAGTYPVTVTLTPTDPASGLPTFSKTATVAIAPKAVALSAEGIQATYDGSYRALSVTLPEGAAANGADAAALLANITYTVDGEAVANAFINAGTTVVTVSSACANYALTPVTARVQIAKRPITLTAGSAEKVYDEQPLSVTYTCNTALIVGDKVTNATGLLPRHTLSATLVNATQTNLCAQAPVQFEAAQTAIAEGGASVLANYEVAYVNGSITITRATGLTLTLLGYADVYDGEAHSVTVASVADGLRNISPARFTFTYGLSAESATASAYPHADVCDLTVYVRGVSVDGNDPDVTGAARLTIKPRPVLVTPDTASYPYDGAAHSVSGYTAEQATMSTDGKPTGTRGLLRNDAVAVTLHNNTQTAPGDYPIAWTDARMLGGVLENYQFEHGDGTLSITPATDGLSLTVAEDTRPYDALLHRLAYTVTAPDGCPVEVAYSVDQGQTFIPVGEDGLLPAYRAAGAYPVKVRATSPYFTEGYAAVAGATLTLTPRVLAIQSETNSFVYNQAAHTVQGLWQLTPSTDAAGLVRDVTNGITHNIASFGYASGQSNVRTAVGGQSVLVDPATVTLLDQAGLNVTANYALTTDAGSLTVTAQPTAAAATTRTAVYNGQPQGFTLPVLTDAAGNPVTEPVTYAYSTDGLTYGQNPLTYENVAAGGYTVYIRASSPNYAPAVATAHLTLTPAPITVRAEVNDGFIYTLGADGQPVMWSVHLAGLTEGALYRNETLAYTLANATQSDVGGHAVPIAACAVMLGDTDVSANYAITLADGHIAVSQGTADAYMLVSPVAGVYNAAAYTLGMPTVLVQTNTDDYVDQTALYSLHYSVSKDGGSPVVFKNQLPHFTDAGEYTVTVTATSNRLASPEPAQTTMTITPRPITFTSGTNESQPYAYTGAAQTVAPWQVADGVLAGEASVAAVAFAQDAGNTATNVCDRAVQLSAVTLAEGNRDVTANYNITLTPGRLVIRPLTVLGGLSLAGATHVYDAGTHGATLSDVLTTPLGTFSLREATLSDGSPRFAVRYTATPQGGGESAQTTVNPGFVDATSQTVTVYVTDLSGNLLITPASAAVTVEKRDVTLTPDSDALPYDGLPHTVATHSHPKAIMADKIAIGTAGLVGTDDVTVTLLGGGPHTLPGEYPITWDAPPQMLSGKAANYNFLHGTGSLTITKAAGIGVALAAPSLCYDGATHGYTATAAVLPGAPYTLAYQTADGEWIPVDAEHPLPTAVNAGAYPLTVRIQSPYYVDTATATATLSILQRAITLQSGDNSALPYGYSGLAQAVPGALVAGDMPLAAGDTVDQRANVYAPGLGNTGTDACDRPVTLTAVTLRNAAGEPVTQNYTVTFASGRLVIQKAASATAPAARSETYAATPYAFAAPVLGDTAGNALAGVQVAISEVPLAADDAGWTAITAYPARETVKRGEGGAVESYMLYVRLSHPNYATQLTTTTLTLQPAAIAVTADSATEYVYTLDGEGAPIAWQVKTATLSKGALYGGATLHYTLGNAARAAIGTQSVFVDSVAVRFGADDLTGNYSITTYPGVLTVKQGTAAATLTAEGGSAVYDGQAQAIAAPVVSVRADDGTMLDRTADFTLTYEVALAGSDQVWQFDSLSDFSLTQAGVYTVTVHAAGTLHATPADAVCTLTIRPRQVSIQSQDNSAAPYAYTGKPQSVRGDATVTNLLAGHTLTALAFAPGKTNTDTAACDRAVLLSGVSILNGRADVTANYDLRLLAGRLVIRPLPIPATDIPVADVTAVYDGLPHGLTLPQTLATEAGDVAVADEFTVTYRDTLGNVAAEPPAYSDAGEYPVTVILTSQSGNYAPETVTATVRITPRPLSLSYGTVETVYDGLAHTVPLTVTGLMARDQLQLTERNRTATNATYAAEGVPGALPATATEVRVSDATDATVNRLGNYTLALTPGTLSILPIPLTVRITPQTVVYDGQPHTLDAFTVVGEPLAGHRVEAIPETVAAVHTVNALPVNLRSLRVLDAAGADVTGNYRLTGEAGTLTITPAPITLSATEVTVMYDGLPHQPEALLIGALQPGDTLAGYALADMPQTEVGRYPEVPFDQTRTRFVNAKGEEVTGDYAIGYGTGSLTITAPTTAYTVQYYYNGNLQATASFAGISGETVSTFPSRRTSGYRLDRTENLPLVLHRDPTQNVIGVYYRSSANYTTLTEQLIPLAGETASYESGTAID